MPPRLYLPLHEERRILTDGDRAAIEDWSQGAGGGI